MEVSKRIKMKVLSFLSFSFHDTFVSLLLAFVKYVEGQHTMLFT